MRVILFRGQRIDNEEWVYGSLSIEYDGSYFISYWIDELIEPENNYRELKCKWHEVKEETVSQFTGLLDKKGNKIFEGDKVKAFGSVYDVVFNDGAFYLRKENINHRLSRTIQDLEVIGNIHEDGNK